jgi:hypothetical protein
VEPLLVPIVQMMTVSSRLFRKSLEGVDSETLRRRPEPGANPMHWIAGHATVVRSGFSAALDRNYPLPWAEHFRRGGTNDTEPHWPPIETIVAAWDAIDPILQQRLRELTAEDVNAPTQAPGFNGTVLGMLELMAFHDVYHVGQLGYLRRLSGLDRLVG